jgi:Ni/Fe-hydrogenase subunit HybB-like protein
VRTFVVLEAIYFAVVGLVFVVLYATRSAWRDTPTGRNVMAFVVGVVALLAALLASLVWAVPTWVFALVMAELNWAMTNRLWLLVLAQRQR